MNFIDAATTNDRLTENGAAVHSTTGNKTLDYFAVCGTYSKRDPNLVAADIGKMLEENPLIALKVLFYLRLVTRNSRLNASEKLHLQKGLGCKDEFIKGWAYLCVHYKEFAKKNAWLVPTVGSWKDLWYDSNITNFFHYTDYSIAFPLIKSGLQDEFQRALIAKYLPRYITKKNRTTPRHERMSQFAIAFSRYMNWNLEEYRRFKSNPELKAHIWQRQITNQEYNKIDFNTISGRALGKIVQSKFLKNHNLTDSYANWINGKPAAPFTGYVHELIAKMKTYSSTNEDSIKVITLNKQYAGIIEKYSKDPNRKKENILVASDGSGSMSFESAKIANGVYAIDVALALTILISDLNDAPFRNKFIHFNNVSSLESIDGNTLFEKYYNLQHKIGFGSTNFQSIIDLLIRVKKQNPALTIRDFPTTIVVVSDMQFNPVNYAKDTTTNHETAIQRLSEYGLEDIRFIWWNVVARTKTVEVKEFTKNTALMSGFDPAALSNILGFETKTEEVIDNDGKVSYKSTRITKTPLESMLEVLNQDILNKVTI